MTATTVPSSSPSLPTIPDRPPVPRTTPAQLRWLVVDSWTLATRELIHLWKQPSEVIGTLLFPIVSVLLFGYVFGSAMTVAGGGDYRSFLMPGLFALTMAVGMANTAMYVVTDVSRGVTDRFRSIPMARGAVVSGRALADVLITCVDLAMLVGMGLVIGWRPGGSLTETAIAIALLLWLRFAVTWVGILLGLAIRTPETAMKAFSLVLPLGMLSNAFVSPELMPTWLGHVASWNPLSSTVTATRELFGNPGVVGGSWLTDNALLMAVLWPAAIVAVAAPLALRRYHRLSR